MSRAFRLDRIVRSTFPLRCAQPGQLPTSTRSGNILAYQGRRFLLTAAHKIASGERWMIEVKANPHTNQTQMYYPGGLNFFYSVSLENGEIAEVDLAFAEVPADLTTFHQEITPFAGLTREVPRYDVALGPPVLSKRAAYGFYGYHVEGLVGQNMLSQNQRLEPDLKYVGDENDLRVFRLNHAHPGHSHYRGCSGAAIVDKHGSLVGVVVGGDEANNYIFGVNSTMYTQAINAFLARE